MNAAEVLLRPAGPLGDAGIALECTSDCAQARAPDRPGAGETKTVSRSELRDRVARLAGAWRRLGLQPGGVVAVRLSDGIGWVEAWLSVIWAGGVAVGINPRLPADEWRATCEEARFAFVIDEAGNAVNAAETAEAAAAARPVEAAAPARTIPTRSIDLAALRAAAGAPVEPQPRRADDPMLWVHSSGTSGRPKAVVHAQRVVNDIARISAERLGLTGADRLFASSRLFFTYPLVNGLLAGLRLGATLLIDQRWPTAAGVATFVQRHRPSVLLSVPALYRGLLHDGHAAALHGSSLRLAVSAGEALPARLRSQWQSASGVPLWNGWGTSETLVLALTAAADEPVLMPSPGVEVGALDEHAAAAGQPTRIVVRCPSIALGYQRRPYVPPDAEAESFRAGRFCAADLFVREGAGWRFAGREDSLVKQRGRWVDLVQLEEQLSTDVRGLREAALACCDDADGLAELRLYFVPTGPAGDDLAVVRSLLAARVQSLPPHQRPARLVALEALPRTATGKLLRRALAASAELAPPSTTIAGAPPHEVSS